MNKKQPSRIPFFQNPELQNTLALVGRLNMGELRLVQGVVEGKIKHFQRSDKPKEREQLELDLQGGSIIRRTT